MATFYTAIGSTPTSMSPNRMREEADRVASGKRHVLDWSHNTSLLYRFTHPNGSLPNLLANRVGVKPDIALTCRAYKDVGQTAIHRDLAKLLDLFGDDTILLRSDGAILALTNSGRIGVSDLPEYAQDPEGWIGVANEYFPQRTRILNQDKLAQALKGDA